MSNDFEKVESIVNAAVGRTASNELVFVYPTVAEVIKKCTETGIAVLGVELFEIRPNGYLTENLSAYDLQMDKGPVCPEEWKDYVAANNLHAEEFIEMNPTGEGHVYVLTTVSREQLRMANRRD